MNLRKNVTEAVVRRYSVKKMFLKNSQKFTGKHLCQSSFFQKVAASAMYLQKNYRKCFSLYPNIFQYTDYEQIYCPFYSPGLVIMQGVGFFLREYMFWFVIVFTYFFINSSTFELSMGVASQLKNFPMVMNYYIRIQRAFLLLTLSK